MIAASTSVPRAPTCREQNASTVPLPYRHEEAPGLDEGSGLGLGVVVGATVGAGLGGAVGVDDPPHDRTTASEATAGRVRQGLIFIRE